METTYSHKTRPRLTYPDQRLYHLLRKTLKGIGALYWRLLKWPTATLLAVASVLLYALSYWPQLVFDASSDTLVVKGDRQFADYLGVAERFPSDEFLLLTVTPKSVAVFSQPGLALLDEVQQAIVKMDGVASTLSVLDVPILDDGETNPYHLHDDLQRGVEAEAYFRNNPMFAGQLIAKSGETAAIRIELTPLSSAETNIDDARKTRADLFDRIRNLRFNYIDRATMQMAGVPLVSSDMVRFVRSDVVTFGVASAFIMCGVLFAFFRRARWMALCVINSAVSIGLVVGLMAAIGTPVSVVSANFISLLAIITVSLTIHMVVRYRELLRTNAELPHSLMVETVVRSKFAPCFYTALTTVVAFSSLLTSDIPPVEDFGWMMSAGVVVSFIVSFLVFPCGLLILPKGQPSTTLHREPRLAVALGQAATASPRAICGAALVLMMIAVIGISRLSLDSHFSGYFRSGSDIRQGLEFVDSNFGGVLSLDVIIREQPFEAQILDEEDDFYVETDSDYPAAAWFTAEKIRLVADMSGYLRANPDVGSVSSLADFETLARTRTNGRALSDVELAVAISLLEPNFREQLISPYANPDSGELRLSIRMREQAKTAEYPTLVADITRKATTLLNATGLSSAEPPVLITGMFILFGQSLRQLYDSQRDTLIYVALATLLTFVILLKSLSFGLLGIGTNVLAAASILGFMGLAGIPLDAMTITIAAIAIGIGVDDAIHYLHRYRDERTQGLSPEQAIRACSGSVGRAIYFTSITVIAGFSVLALSHFVPTIYFGSLTALAMLLALIGNLLLLPSAILVYERWRGFQSRSV